MDPHEHARAPGARPRGRHPRHRERVFAYGLLLLAALGVHGDSRARPSDHASDARVPWTGRVVPPGATLESMFGEHWEAVARFNRIDRIHALPGVRLKVPRRFDDLIGFTPLPRWYAPADSEPRSILVDLQEQYLGAYEFGQLVMAFPVTTGTREEPTPTGTFRVDAADPDHHSSLYRMNDGVTPYPMHHGLRFLVAPEGVTYWIHGRDLPGFPASHGCIGLYDEPMQSGHYGIPRVPVLDDSRELFDWAVGPWPEGQGMTRGLEGPVVRIVEDTSGAPGDPATAPTGGASGAGRDEVTSD